MKGQDTYRIDVRLDAEAIEGIKADVKWQIDTKIVVLEAENERLRKELAAAYKRLDHIKHAAEGSIDVS